MNFEEYLHSKKIDSSAFKGAEIVLFEELQQLFDQMHPDSFSAQKLFLLNPLRRKYKLSQATQSSKTKPLMKPKIVKPKI